MSGWTDELEALGKKLRQQDGLPYSQIAKKLGHGLTRSAVIGKGSRDNWDEKLPPKLIKPKPAVKLYAKVKSARQSKFGAQKIIANEPVAESLQIPAFTSDEGIAAYLKEVATEKSSPVPVIKALPVANVLEREIVLYAKPAENLWDEERKKIIARVLNVLAILRSNIVPPPIRQVAILAIEKIDEAERQGKAISVCIKDGPLSDRSADLSKLTEERLASVMKWQCAFIAKHTNRNFATLQV